MWIKIKIKIFLIYMLRYYKLKSAQKWLWYWHLKIRPILGHSKIHNSLFGIYMFFISSWKYNIVTNKVHFMFYGMLTTCQCMILYKKITMWCKNWVTLSCNHPYICTHFKCHKYQKERHAKNVLNCFKC